MTRGQTQVNLLEGVLLLTHHQGADSGGYQSENARFSSIPRRYELPPHLNLNSGPQQNDTHTPPCYGTTSSKYLWRHTDQLMEIASVAALQKQRNVAISRVSAQDMNGDTARD